MSWLLGVCLAVLFALPLLTFLLGWTLTKLNIGWYKKALQKTLYRDGFKRGYPKIFKRYG